MSRSVRTPTRRPSGSAHEDRIAGAGPLDRGEAVGEARARRDGHGLAPAEDLEPLVDEGRDARATARSVSSVTRASVVRPRAGPVAALRSLAARMDRRHALGIALVLVRRPASAPAASSPARLRAGRRLARSSAWRFVFGALLAWLWVLAWPDRRAACAACRAGDRRRLGLGVLYTGNSGTYYAGLETVPARSPALIVYIYPAIVAVLSLRVRGGCRPAAVVRPGARARRRGPAARRHHRDGAVPPLGGARC